MNNAIVFLPLTQGKVAVIDFADFEKVRHFTWHANKQRRRIYARRHLRRPDGSRTKQCLHQFLMPGAKEVDHIDGDGLNNSRSNLRAVTRTQNKQGFHHKRLGATSKYRGVNWHRGKAKWQAEIQVNGKGIYLGTFSDEGRAARAYDAAAQKHFGEFASLNFNKQTK